MSDNGPLIGYDELSRAQVTLNEIIERHKGAGEEGIEAGWRECNFDPLAATDLVNHYTQGAAFGDKEAYLAGMLHGMMLGGLACSFIADSYIIDVR
jgi:hypothetical protein